MTPAELLVEVFGRLRPLVHEVVDNLTEAQLSFRLDAEANTITWLIWHLTRVQDHHLADASGSEQVWTTSEWAERFGLPARSDLTGYGDSPDEVAVVHVDDPEVLTGYYDAVHQRTMAFLEGLGERDLDKIVDESFDPPVTLGVRLVSVLGDDLEHVGQAAYLRGIIERR